MTTEERIRPEYMAGDGARVDGQTLRYLGQEVTARDLLQRYNPVLVLLPRDDGLGRPGSWLRGRGRGDYYPCSARFFISKLAWYPRKRGIIKAPSKKEPERPGFIHEKVIDAAGRTEDWEIDIAPFNSGDAKGAWRIYAEWLQKEEDARACVTYGRCVPEGDRVALQYWYLYIYNDAGNTHEGDWETVAIELDTQGGPVQVGYSGHNGGARRRWQGITSQGDHPIVYVARGSHAAYLDHMPLGHKTAHLDFDKGLPPIVKQVVGILQNVLMRLLYFWGVRDYTSSIEDEGDGNQGRLITPDVCVMPDSATVQDEHWWWMNLNCRWGSSHTRIRDFIAPEPPWMKAEKWKTPLRWIYALPER